MNILLLSSIYPTPGPENRGTKVCHYFAQEWTKMGHDVRVVHYQAVYPRPFYWMVKIMRNYIAAKTGAVIYTQRDKTIKTYEIDTVQITKIPLFKPLPHGKFSSKGLTKSIDEIIRSNTESNFRPDLIVGHFINPQLEVISKLKKIYTRSKAAIVYHLPAEIKIAKEVYGENLSDFITDIDFLGFRNKAIMRIFEKNYNISKPKFICYSGIPESYITDNNTHIFKGKLKKFIYVGEMIERKFPSKIIDALQRSYPDGDYSLSYVGEGQQISVIQKKIDLYGLEKSVTVLGKMPRDEIKDKYDQAECMIMISKGEAYGLVYLEAMARGCITIASREEGMDGIIEDGVNGFLCCAGDDVELSNIINHINSLSDEERTRISNNAIQTAKRLTDTNAAKMYIDELTK